MASFNKVILAGNLTRDPEFKQLNSGQALCKLGLAVNRNYKNRQTGAPVQEVCFIDVEVWGPQADTCRQYLQKGSGVLVEGRLKLETWEDAQGNKKNRHTVVADSVVFLGRNNGSVGSQEVGDDSQAPEFKDKALFDQLEALKNKQAQAKSVGAHKLNSEDNEIAFPDEQPFSEKQLPF